MAARLVLARKLVSGIENEDIGHLSCLLHDGAPPNLVLPADGVSPLHLAVGSDSRKALEFTTLFLEYGGNPNVRSTEGLTPVHVAASWGRFQALELLLRNGGDPTLTDEDGSSPRDMAVANGHWDCIHLLECWMREDADTDQDEGADQYEGDDGTGGIFPGDTCWSLCSEFDEGELNNAMRSFGLGSCSPSSLCSLSCSSDSSPVLQASPAAKQDDQSVIQPVNFSDAPKSPEPTSSSQSDQESIDNPHPDILLSGMGLDVTSPDHTVIFSKAIAKDRRRTVFCGLQDAELSSGLDESGAEDEPDNGRVSFDIDIVSGSAESPTGVNVLQSPKEKSKFSLDCHAQKGAVMDNPSEVACPELMPNSQDSCNEDPGEDSSGEMSIYHTAVDSDSSVSSGSTHSRSVYRNRRSCLELIEDHLPPAASSEPSLLDFSIASADETVIYDWTSFRSDQDEEEDQQERPPISAELAALSNEEIMSQLKDHGEGTGPVTSTTRSVYLNLLARLSQSGSNIAARRLKDKQDPSNPNFQYELAEVLSGAKPPPVAHDLEAEMVAQFQQPDPRRRWREGVLKSSFNYLLLDPRVTRDLPVRYPMLTQLETFRTFVSAVFYVGKGKRSRPYAHFEEALKYVTKSDKKPSPKVLHILDIWSGGMGVVSLHCFQNVIPVEAYTREACMMEAIGLLRLTNAKRGDYYGAAHGWSKAKKRRVGVHLLGKACQIFLMEGERQIRSADIAPGQ